MRTDVYLVFIYAFIGMMFVIATQLRQFMSLPLYFYFIVLGTVVFTRFFLYIKPVRSPTVRDFEMHHYMYGLMIMPVGVVMGIIEVYALGFGLFVDELTFFLMRGRNHQDNYSGKSLIGTVFFTAITFFFKGMLIRPFL